MAKTTRDIKGVVVEAIYIQGFIDGMKCFAWWKNGIQYVGSGGITLEKAIEEVGSLPYYSPPKLEEVC